MSESVLARFRFLRCRCGRFSRFCGGFAVFALFAGDGADIRQRLNAPDIACVVGDRAVGGEVTHVGDVGDRRFDPFVLVAVAAVNMGLRFDVAAEVGQHLVVVAENVQVFVVTARFFRREGARGDLHHGLV